MLDMKNCLIIILSALMVFSCSRGNVPDAVSHDVSFCKNLLQPLKFPDVDTLSYNKKVTITFLGDMVVADTLYNGVEMEREGASLLVRSRVPGVEYRVCGESKNGSLTIVSEFSPLVTLCGVSLVAEGRDVLQISSKELVVVRTEGENSLSDKLLAAKGGKNDAVVNIMGSSLFMGDGHLLLRAERRNALLCTDTMFFCDSRLEVPSAPGNALLLGKSAYLGGGEMVLSSAKDVVKSKKGSFVVSGGHLRAGSVENKADALQVAAFAMTGGAMTLDVKGAASDGVKAAWVCFSGGVVTAMTDGDALFSEKKMDYSSASCIKADSCIYITGGDLALESSGSGAKGISCDGDMVVDGGSVHVVTRGEEALHPIDLNAHASCKGIKCDRSFVLNGGEIDVCVFGRGERNEGVEAKMDMAVNGGSMYVYAYDDAVNVGSRFVMNGGTIYCYSAANDALDSNSSVTMAGGVLIADGSFSPEQGVDVDDFSRFTMNGGTVVAVGGGMGPLSSLPLNAATDVPAICWSGVPLKKGNFLNVEAVDGKSLISYSLTRDMPGGTVLVAGSGMELGTDYILSVSSAIEGGKYTGYGLHYGNAAVDRSEVVKVSLDEFVSIVDSEGKVSYMKPGVSMSGFGFPPPPPGMMPGGKGAPDGGFPPPPPARDIKDAYSESNLPNHDK